MSGISSKVNNPKAANIVVLGALIAKTGLFEKELALKLCVISLRKKEKESLMFKMKQHSWKAIITPFDKLPLS